MKNLVKDIFTVMFYDPGQSRSSDFSSRRIGSSKRDFWQVMPKFGRKELLRNRILKIM